METTLHRQFKTLYSSGDSQTEKKLGAYRIDVATENQLIEIQHSSLSSIRNKVADLLENYSVLVVKPLVVKKRIVRLSRKGGKVVSRRWSPKQGDILDFFDELLYFRTVFPHPNLQIDVPQVNIEEWRYSGHGRKVRRRKDDFQLQDQMLLDVHSTIRFQYPADLINVLPPFTSNRFDTSQLAKWLGVPRWRAQKIAYTLVHCGAIRKVAKEGNTVIYQVLRSAQSTAKRVA